MFHLTPTHFAFLEIREMLNSGKVLNDDISGVGSINMGSPKWLVYSRKSIYEWMIAGNRPFSETSVW